LRIPVILGPTGSGKTAAVVQLGHPFEAIACDSRQLYEGLEITTTAPTDAEQRSLPHHLVSILNPQIETNAYDYRRLCISAIEDVIGRNRIPVLVVGTGFYFKVLRTNIQESKTDPEARNRALELKPEERLELIRTTRPELLHDGGGAIHLNDAYRIQRAAEMILSSPVTRSETRALPYSFHAFHLTVENSELSERLRLRANAMLENGMIEEIERVHSSMGMCPGLRAIGASLVSEFLRGGINRTELAERLWINHRQYAKKQRTWFRRELAEKSGNAAEFAAWIRLFVDPGKHA